MQAEAIHVMNGGTPTFSADTISKIMAALDRCDKQADPIVVHRILKDLDMFVSQINPEFANQCTPFHKQFLQHRIKIEG